MQSSNSSHIVPQISSMPQRHTVSSDRQVVLQLLLNLEFEVNDYDREIVKHRAAIALLEKRKDGAVKTMANLRTFLSPIHKLPPEVLNRIFAESVDFSDRDYSKRRRMPLILTKVCRRWRDVSVAYPALWSKFLVLEDDWGTSGHVDIMNCYMKRSQQYPLTINLELPTVDSLTYVQEDDYLRPGLAALVPHSPRWQRLTISGYPIWLLDHPIFETIKGRLPQLEHLEIRQEYCGGGGASDDYDVFSDCPQLRAVTTEWPPSHAPMVAPSLLEVIRVPWVQIRSCTVGVGELTTLLSLPCGGLEHLCIEDCEGDDPEDMSGNQKLVSNVSSLKFEGCGEALLNLLNHLSFPRVSSLDILYKPRMLHPLVECIAQPSSTSLTSLVLDLHSDCKTDAELVSLLRHTPMVHTLSVRTFSWSAE
ncbi:hypothetical protein V5O48_011229, partial [Marasmius crinis-equi]